jgi:sugar phosphate isomerase/epimerase
MLDRRSFLGSLGALALGGASRQPRGWLPAPSLGRLDRIGLQLYTVRQAMQDDFEGTLEKVAAIGYREVEFAGYFDRRPSAVRAVFARWPGRFRMVHVKDSTGAPRHEMTDVGRGTIDWKRIFARREQAGIRHFFVEHDQPADPFASIRASYAYLARLKF